METEAEMDVMGSSANTSSWARAWNNLDPPEGTSPADPLISDFWSPEQTDTGSLLFKAPSGGRFVTGAVGKDHAKEKKKNLAD